MHKFNQNLSIKFEQFFLSQVLNVYDRSDTLGEDGSNVHQISLKLKIVAERGLKL
jgi:hypothetical protein